MAAVLHTQLCGYTVTHKIGGETSWKNIWLDINHCPPTVIHTYDLLYRQNSLTLFILLAFSAEPINLPEDEDRDTLQ